MTKLELTKSRGYLCLTLALKLFLITWWSASMASLRSSLLLSSFIFSGPQTSLPEYKALLVLQPHHQFVKIMPQSQHSRSSSFIIVVLRVPSGIRRLLRIWCDVVLSHRNRQKQLRKQRHKPQVSKICELSEFWPASLPDTGQPKQFQGLFHFLAFICKS